MKGRLIIALISLAGMALFLQIEGTEKLGIFCGLVCLVTCSSGWLHTAPNRRYYW